jgi:hypothetical protein
MEDLMTGRPPAKVPVEAYRADRDRLRELADALTAEGNGRFYQAETIRWLLDWRDRVLNEVTEEAIEKYAKERQP